MLCINILLFLVVFVSSHNKCSTTPIRHGAFSVGEEPAQLGTSYMDQNTRKLEDLPPFINLRGDVGENPRTTADDRTDVHDSQGHAHHISIRSASNGNQTGVLMEHTIKNGSVCEHQLNYTSDILLSYQMEESVSCRWHISAPQDFIVTIALAVLKHNDSSLAPADSAGIFCLPNGTRIVFTEFLPDSQPKETAFCEVKSVQLAALTFTTLSNKVSIDVYTRRSSQITWALWYQAVDKSFVEVAYDYVEDVGSGLGIPELSTASYDIIEKWSGMSAEQCFDIDGMSIRSKNISFSNNESCSLTFLPGLNEELMLSFLDVDLSDPFVTNCSNENAFITLRTWKPDGNIIETFLCSFNLMETRFTSPVRIELNYHPSAVTRRDFTAEISAVVPDINMGGTELSHMLLTNTLIYSLTDERGHLATLGYPSHFPSMRMIWDITVGQGKAINLEFVDIDFGYTPPSTCTETTPILIIMLSALGNKQQIFCGSLPLRNITSTGSKMIIIFDPRAGNVESGVQAVYTSFDHENNSDDVFWLSSELPFSSLMLATASTVFADCEFLFMKDSGNFTKLDYQIVSPVNYTTCWHIMSGPSNFIKNLFKNSPFLDSFDDDDDDDSESGMEDSNTALLTTSHATTSFADGGDHFLRDFDIDGAVALSTEPTVPSTKLSDVSLAFADCPYVFTEDNGTFSTFRYPNDYPANYSTCWYISTDPSRFIMLRFRNFSLDSAQVDPCDKAYSFVTVNDFVADAVDLCGTLENQLFKSSSNRLKIGIDGRLGQGQGFYAMYETFKIPRFRSHLATGDAGSCNATEHLESLIILGNVRLPALMSKCTVDGIWLEWFTEAEMESGWIASPLFPGRYPAGSRCMWIVRAQENVMINLNFLDFDLGEAPGTYPPCSDADTFIRIRDCVSGEEQILCGIETENEQLVIQSNSVEIEFYSESGYGRGFQAFYNLERSSVEGQQFRFLPEGLTPFPAYRVGPSMTTEEELLPQSQMSTSSPEVEEITMDLSCEDAGSDKCGGSLQSEFGYFSSAFYPEELQTKTNCTWTIASSLPDYQIALKILDIDLGAPMIDGKCDARSAYIKVEISGDSAFICSNYGQNLFVSEAGLIKVEFYSELSAGRGFCAAFMSIDSTFNGNITDLQFPCLCKNLHTNISWFRLSAEPTEPTNCEFMIGEGSGTLPSESFHIPYPPNLECVWTLSARPGEYVNLRFLSFDLDGFRVSNRRRCLLSDTHVQITLFKDEVLNKRFCSDDDWSVAIPPSRDVTIKFISGDIPDHSHTGFRLAYNFTLTASSSKVFHQDFADNTSVSESSEDNFGFRVFNDYDGYSSFSSAGSPDEEVIVETGRRTTEGDRTRLTWPVEVETEIPDLGLFSDYATEIPDVYDTDLPDTEADILTTASAERTLRTYSVDELTTRTSTSSTSGVNPGRGQMTAREMELTIYICTALAALLIIVLILVTLYCAKNRRSSSKAGFDVDAADEANYWQTYKDWAKDWVTEPVAGSAQSTVGAMCDDESGTAPKRLPSSGDPVGADASALSPGHLKTVSAVINEPPIDKPERNFIQSEKLV